jgi:hypothetical protein
MWCSSRFNGWSQARGFDDVKHQPTDAINETKAAASQIATDLELVKNFMLALDTSSNVYGLTQKVRARQPLITVNVVRA